MTDRTRSAPQANPVGEEETSSKGGRAANRGGKRRRGSTSGSGGEAASAATAPRRRAEKNDEPEYEEGSPGESLERMGKALIAQARKAAVRNLWAVVSFLELFFVWASVDPTRRSPNNRKLCACHALYVVRHLVVP